jgi:hypothetical protein
MFTSMKVSLSVKGRINRALALAKVPPYSTNPLHAYAIEERMKQLGRLDRYQKELSKITSSNNIPLIGQLQINVAGLRSKLLGSTVV